MHGSTPHQIERSGLSLALSTQVTVPGLLDTFVGGLCCRRNYLSHTIDIEAGIFKTFNHITKLLTTQNHPQL